MSDISTTISELLSQYEILVHTHSIVASESTVRSDLLEKYRKFQENKQSDWFDHNFEAIKNTIVGLCRENDKQALKILESLVEILNNYTILRDLNSKKKAILPEKKENVDYIDNVIMGHMIECIKIYKEEMLKGNLKKLIISDSVHKVCYDRIYLDQLIEMAGKLLGEISSFQLNSILDIALPSIDKIGKSKEDSKNYIPLLKIAKYLDFSFEDNERMNGTIKYLHAIRQKLNDTKKGKKEFISIFSEILCHIMERSLSGWNMQDNELDNLTTPDVFKKRKENVLNYLQNTETATRFWSLFTELYETFLKMAGKKEAPIEIVHCMGTMLCRAKEDLYHQYVPDLFKYYASGVKDKKDRFIFFNSIKEFLTYLPSDYLTKDVENFQTFVKSIIDQVFNRKVIYGMYKPIVESFLIEYARKQMHISWPKTIEEILKPENYKNYSDEQREVALSAVAKVSKLYPDEIGKLNYILGPLCTSILLEERYKTDLNTVRNVLKCFPRVKNVSEERMKDVRSAIGQYLLHSDKLVARSASDSLILSVELDPGKTFLEVIEHYVNVLVKVDEVSPEVGYKLLRDLFIVTETFILKTLENAITIDSTHYNSLRKKVEGMLLMYIIHTSSLVRNQAIKVLKQFSRKELRSLVKDNETTYLLDGFLKIPEQVLTSTEYIPWLPCVEELCRNHSDEAINKAWEELAKRWNSRLSEADEQKVRLIGNYLKFMCLSLRPTLGGKSEVFINDLIQLLKSNLNIKQHEKLKGVVMDALELTHPSSLYVILTQIRATDIPRIFIKKENKIESSDAQYEQLVIDLLKRIITKSINYVTGISPSEFLFVKQGILCRDFYDELISNWTTKERIDVKDIAGSYVTLETWKDTVVIISTYLKHLNIISKQTALEKGIEVPESAVLYSNMFKKNTLINSLMLIFKYLHYQHPLSSFCQEAVDGMKFVCSFGMVEEERFINEILHFFENVIVNKRDVDIVPGMAQFLLNNPQTIRTFITNTYAESFYRVLKEEDDLTDEDDDKLKVKKSPLFGSGNKKEIEDLEKQKSEKEYEKQKFKSTIPYICKSYFSAIVSVMEDYLDHWITDQHTTLGSLFYLAMVHSCTRNNLPLRDKAHELTSILIKSESSNHHINFSNTYHCTSVGDESVYKRTIEKFSEYVSKVAPEITSDLFGEADRTVDLLDGVNRENTLRILMPWSYNYGMLVKSCLDTANTTDTAYRMKDFASQRLLKVVYSVTEKLHGIEMESTENGRYTGSLLKHYTEQIWLNLIKSSVECKWVIPEVVKFIIENYDFAFNQLNVNQPVNAVHSFLRALFAYICRDERSLPFILETIMSFMRDYKTKLPDTKKDYAKFINERSIVDPIDAEFTTIELSCLQLLVDISYEHDIAFIPHLPKLFLNCVVLFNSCQNSKNFSEPKLILENLLQSLAIRHRDHNTTTVQYVDKAFEFMVKYFRTNPQVKLSREREFLIQWVEYISKKHCPNLSELISEMALSWGMKAKDNKISLESYYIFEALNKDFSIDVIEKLVMAFFDAVRVRDDSKILIIMDILFNIPSEKLCPPRVSKLLFQVTFWLMFSWNKSHFKRALKYMLRLQSLSKDYDNIDESVLNSSMFNVWKGYTGGESIPVSVARVIFKGLTDDDTFSQTFELYNNLILRFEPFIPKGDNMLIATSLIIQAVLYSIGDFSKKSLQNKLFEQNADKLGGFKTCFDTFEQAFAKIKSKLVTNEENVSELTEFNNALTSMAESFANEYKTVFANKDGNYVMWLLAMLLKNGNMKWSLGVITLLKKLLPVIFTPGEWSLQEIIQLSSIIRECIPDSKTISHSKNPLFSSSAKDINEFLAYHAHEKQDKYTRKEANMVFEFLSSIKGFTTSVRAKKPADADLFIGTTKEEKEIARTEMLCRMWYQVFNLQIDSATNEEEAKLLNELLAFQSPSSITESSTIANYTKVVAERRLKQSSLDSVQSGLVTPTKLGKGNINISTPQLEPQLDMRELDEEFIEQEQVVHIPPPPEDDSDDEKL
ncbi:hypothetical protein ABK040_014361 [Willaertia magna]